VAIAGLLREAVNGAHADHAAAHDQATATLAGNEIWSKLDSTQQAGLLGAVGLTAPVKPDVSSDEALGRHLDGRPLRVARAERDAIPGRVQQAIERAAKALEPKVQTVTLERSTLHNEQEIDTWLGRQRDKLVTALKSGPVLTQ
jgi:hypothetical protein